MNELPMSPALYLSYRLAVGETVNLGQEKILPDLFFCGITKLQDALDPYLIQQLGFSPEAISAAIVESTAVLLLLQQYSLDAREVRHTLRERIGQGSRDHIRANPVSRADETRAAFARAETMAVAHEYPHISLRLLFAALLELEDSYMHTLLLEQGVAAADLRHELLDAQIRDTDADVMGSATIYDDPDQLPYEPNIPSLTLIKEYGSMQETRTFHQDTITLGRPDDDYGAPDFDLSPDRHSHRRHAQLTYRDRSWWVKHLGGRKGTLLNGTQVSQPLRVEPGDELLLGQTKVHIETIGTDQNAGVIETEFTAAEEPPQDMLPQDRLFDIFDSLQKTARHTHDYGLLSAFREELMLHFPQAQHHEIFPATDGVLIPHIGGRGQSHFSSTLLQRAVERRTAFRWLPTLGRTGDSRVESLSTVTSALYAPMILNGQIVGVLGLETTLDSTDILTETDLRLLQVVAGYMAGFLGAASLGPIYQLFFVYDDQDRALVSRLKRKLLKHGIRSLDAQQIKPGENRKKAVLSAFRDVQALLVINSPNSQNSDYVAWALGLARQKRKKVIPLLVEGGVIPETLQNTENVNIVEGDQEHNERELMRLAAAIKALPQRGDDGRGVEPVKILLLASNPLGEPPLDLDEEIRQIKRSLQSARFRDLFDFQPEVAVQYGELSELIQDYEPQILQISGHGKPDGTIYLRDEKGNPHPLRPEALPALLRAFDHTIELIILNACGSIAQAELLKEHVNCVVTVAGQIKSSAALRFSSSFYQGLAYGRSVQQAFDLSASELIIADQPDQVRKPQLTVQPGIDAADEYFVY